MSTLDALRPMAGHRSGGIVEPLEPGLRRMLRRAVLAHAESGPRRVQPPVLHVGTPERDVRHPVLPQEPADHALRVDIVAALRVRASLDGTPRHAVVGVRLVWLTRGGELSTQDVDVEWLNAARQASAEAEAEGELVFVVVTRHGWFDPRTGVGRHWPRIRQR